MEHGQTVWIVGQTLDDKTSSWHFQGVFSTKEEAVAACVQPNYFCGPAVMGVAFPHETVAWEGAFYPAQAAAVA